MALRMARPIRLKTTSSIYFRQRIPMDVIGRVRGSTLAVPVGNEVCRVAIGKQAKEIKLSLRTSSAHEARKRHREVAEHLGGWFESLRKGPVSLTHKQTVALSGEVYLRWVKSLEDNPKSARLWEAVQKFNKQALEGNYGKAALMIGKENRRAAALEERFGGMADVTLAHRGLVIDQASRFKLLEQVANATTLAAERLKQNANSDYSPDSNVARFGTFERNEASSCDQPRLGWDDLIDAWAKEARPKEATVDQWRGYMRHLADATGLKSPASLTKSDVIKWKDTLVAAGGAAKTINDSKLAALKTLLNWAVANGRLEANIAQGVRVRQKKKAGSGMRRFSDEQAKAILDAAYKSDNPVRRWVPFLCALSGARVAEMAQLRKQDVSEKDGIPYVQLRPEAGSLKNANSERDVPLHPFLIEMGFVKFVKAQKDGPLFYDPARRRTDAKKPPAKIVAKNLAAWVNKLDVGVGRSQRIDPNHGWRHWFSATARALGIPDSVVDHIEGRGPQTVGQGYGDVNLRTKLDAISKIPVPGRDRRSARAAA